MNSRTPLPVLLALSLLAAPLSGQEAATTALDDELRAMIAVPASAPVVDPDEAADTTAASAWFERTAASDEGAAAERAVSVAERAVPAGERAARADDELVGGQYIVISTTAVLLALIVLLVVAD